MHICEALITIYTNRFQFIVKRRIADRVHHTAYVRVSKRHKIHPRKGLPNTGPLPASSIPATQTDPDGKAETCFSTGIIFYLHLLFLSKAVPERLNNFF